MDTYSNRPGVLLGVLWTETGLATLFTVARFYARILVQPGLGWDDWTMLIALVSPLQHHQCFMMNVSLPATTPVSGVRGHVNLEPGSLFRTWKASVYAEPRKR